MAELLTKEQLAEIERWAKGPTTETWFNNAQQRITTLLTHCRALEAEVDRLKAENEHRQETITMLRKRYESTHGYSMP